ncbi:MAG: hypothetical protein AB1798_21490 [Spirochaetota bacterium]
MKRLIFSFIFLFSAFLLCAQATKSIKIINSTGYIFHNIYLSTGETENWEYELLNGQTLQDSESRVFILPDIGPDMDIIHLQAIDDEGDSYFIYDIDLQNYSEIEFTLEDLHENTVDTEYDDDTEHDYESYDDYQYGYDDGYREGYKDGFKAAYTEAYKEGYKAGFEEGQTMEE